MAQALAEDEGVGEGYARPREAGTHCPGHRLRPHDGSHLAMGGSTADGARGAAADGRVGRAGPPGEPLRGRHEPGDDRPLISDCRRLVPASSLDSLCGTLGIPWIYTMYSH